MRSSGKIKLTLQFSNSQEDQKAVRISSMKTTRSMPVAAASLLILMLTGLLIISAIATNALADGYLIGDRDVVKVIVYDHPDLTSSARVEEDGIIFLPLIGAVKARGLTVQQLQDEVARRYADGYIVEPNVSIHVTEYRSKKAYVLGEVNKPGLYEITGNATVLEAISKAEGLTRTASDRLVITRPDSSTNPEGTGGKGISEINLARLLREGEISLNLPISDGYVLFIPKADMFYIHGEVKGPGYYKLEEGATFLKAIIMAGGVTNKSAEKRTVVTRVEEGRSVTVQVNLSDPVRPDDVIKVPESNFYIYGEVKTPGYYKLEEGTTFLRAIVMAGGPTGKAAKNRTRCIRGENGEELEKRVPLSDMVHPDDIIYVPESLF